MPAAPRRLVLAGLLLVVAVLAAPAAAHADLPWSPCPARAGFECATHGVPLDRTGAIPGTVTLSATRVPASSNPGRTAVVALAGGPGQAAVPIATDFADVLSPALTQRDLVVFDQRGTGGSGSLDCRALRDDTSLVTLARRCADELGPARGLYRTVDSVEDLESLRAAAGYEKLVLYGVSYGTKVAEAYAAAHPERVESLVLDSVVLPEGPDPFRRSSLAAVPRVLRDLCAEGACRRATPHVLRDVRALARRLRTRSLRGTVIDSRGGRRRASLDETGLLEILLAGDFNPTLRAELPGAMRAALDGDAAPLLRLGARSAGLEHGAQSARADSDALFLATVCEESPIPWTREAPIERRSREVDAAARQLAPATLGPFSAEVAVRGGVAPLCLGWPTSSPAPAPVAPLPGVPVLLLEGQMDLRTPVEDAVALAARVPGAQVVTVPYTGHSVLGGDGSSCAGQAVAAFFAGRPAAACAPARNTFLPTRRPPARLASLPGSGLRRKTAAAARATVLDAMRQVIGASLAFGRVVGRVGGLRAGTVRASGDRFALRGYEYVPGVRVTGTVDARGVGTIRVRSTVGPSGTLFLAAGGAVSGTLGGRRVELDPAAASAALRLPSLNEIRRREEVR